ncbi:carboxypeptidase-like regulatory domain-containing protein [Hymenobacter metallilatus]|uniref:carboxypeptidase-like regulatory domain-containing protein n=1 Tax=Hymenobacter metallilatus TaxID=2493666 RepID=UPI00163B5308|nr:carboxypeptidase-like regulatory domain-containing protein [Hymenobacter metallilatus]
MLCILSSPLLAQAFTLEGQVRNARTNQPVPFATLGIIGRNIGTVADEEGRYILRFPAAPTDSLVITSVGFFRAAVSPQALLNGQREFALLPLEQALPDVVVERKPVHPALLGRNKEKGDVLWTAGSSGKETVDDEWGWELGTVLMPKHPAYLDALHVYLATNTYEQLRFRLNLYTLENGRPGRTLLSQDIQLTTTNRQRGWIQLDLSSYDIRLEAQPVVATIQWLQSEKTEPWDKYFSIPVLRQSKQTMVERENSQAVWSIHAMQPSLYFTVLMEVDKR